MRFFVHIKGFAYFVKVFCIAKIVILAINQLLETLIFLRDIGTEGPSCAKKSNLGKLG